MPATIGYLTGQTNGEFMDIGTSYQEVHNPGGLESVQLVINNSGASQAGVVYKIDGTSGGAAKEGKIGVPGSEQRSIKLVLQSAGEKLWVKTEAGSVTGYGSFRRFA